MTLSAASPCTRVRWWVPLCLIALLACSDDDDKVAFDAGAKPSMRDAGPIPDAHMDAAVDAARPNNPKDSSVDASDASREDCKRVPTAWEYFPNGTLISLDVYCNSIGGCPASLDAFMGTLSCTDVDADAGNDADAGPPPCADSLGWLRREGCGKVAFDIRQCDWPRDLVFDANTGAVIGGARLDDIGVRLSGTNCFDAVYVAGERLQDCANETHRICMRKP